MRIKGFFKDLGGFFRIKRLRKKAQEKASIIIKDDEITNIAHSFHPGKIKGIVSDIKKETASATRIKFKVDEVPLFYAGNYLTIELNINNHLVTRPYSIITSPKKAYLTNEIEIIVKEEKDGYVSKYLNHDLKIDDEVILEIGLGSFNYDKYKDNKNILAIAGGVGITPFIAIAHDIIDRNLDINLTILYGCNKYSDLIAKEELDSFNDPRVKIIYVIDDINYQGEKGFINQEIIKKYLPENPSIFFSGSINMYNYVIKELESLEIDIRRIRKDYFPIKDISTNKDYPLEAYEKTFDIEVHQGLEIYHIKALGKDNLAVSLEKAGLKIHTGCLSGACGFCRIKILKGDYFLPKENDYRRYSDKEFHYVHACSTYPLSDLVIKINI